MQAYQVKDLQRRIDVPATVIGVFLAGQNQFRCHERLDLCAIKRKLWFAHAKCKTNRARRRAEPPTTHPEETARLSTLEIRTKWHLLITTLKNLVDERKGKLKRTSANRNVRLLETVNDDGAVALHGFGAVGRLDRAQQRVESNIAGSV